MFFHYFVNSFKTFQNAVQVYVNFVCFWQSCRNFFMFIVISTQSCSKEVCGYISNQTIMFSFLFCLKRVLHKFVLTRGMLSKRLQVYILVLIFSEYFLQHRKSLLSNESLFLNTLIFVGMFIAVLVIAGSYPSHVAVPQSFAAVFGVSVASFVFLVMQKHPQRQRPLIDYLLCLILEPATLLGKKF